jgi:hypothetical protein
VRLLTCDGQAPGGIRACDRPPPGPAPFSFLPPIRIWFDLTAELGHNRRSGYPGRAKAAASRLLTRIMLSQRVRVPRSPNPGVRASKVAVDDTP